jgi:hypothetical protein
MAEIIPSMQPTGDIVSGDGKWCLASSNGNYLIYTEDREQLIALNLPQVRGGYRARWIDSRTGQVTEGNELPDSKPQQLKALANALWLSHRSDDN